MTDKWALYDIFIDDQLAYVGTTNRPAARLSQHKLAGTVPYFAEMVVVQWFDAQREALTAESKRINDLQPPRNIRECAAGRVWIGRAAWVVNV